ncbi:MAG: phenylalanine--tRNA ligase subunit beta [Candidatus Aenigmarchaeota archaeon]|nr:phenylalanine--tRNA ligase subunit beta [Candidatus Aenigmarchaeota archaeon]
MPVIEVDQKDLAGLCKIPEGELEAVLQMVKASVDEKVGKWKLEITGDRPDLLSTEGVARAVLGFIGKETGLAEYKVEKSKYELKVGKVSARPYILGAVIEGVKLTDQLIKSIVQMQEKLHEGVGRKRMKVALGINDLDKIKFPVNYTEKTEEFKFTPLGLTKDITLKDILEKTAQGKAYGKLLEGFKKYPILMDSAGKVISMPPIVMSERVKIGAGTKNIFVDVTGTDLKAVSLVLNLVVSAIAERGGKIKSVTVGGKQYPNFSTETIKVSVGDIDKTLGLGLKEKEVVSILERMRYGAKALKGGVIEVSIPAYRGDILHWIDIAEDVAIGYGYNNIQPFIPRIGTVGKILEKTKMNRKAREVMAGLGFQEILTFVLTSNKNQFQRMELKGEGIKIENPISSEFETARAWLLPGMLKILEPNKHRDYPQKIFEIGDCVLKGGEETGYKNVRKIAAVVTHDTANLTEIKSFLEAFCKLMGKKIEIRPVEHKSFIDSRAAEVFSEGKSIGIFGEIHPSLLQNFGLEKPAIAFELDLNVI